MGSRASKTKPDKGRSRAIARGSGEAQAHLDGPASQESVPEPLQGNPGEGEVFLETKQPQCQVSPQSFSLPGCQARQEAAVCCGQRPVECTQDTHLTPNGCRALPPRPEVPALHSQSLCVHASTRP